jgi:hypothetical protein
MSSAPDDDAVESEEARRHREAVFGDVLPEQTSDDAPDSDTGSDDEWLRDEVPPHHGG